MSEPLSGDVENGARLPVSFPFFTGLAGVRMFGDVGELACAANLPVGAAGAKGQVDGRAAEIVAASRSATAAGMIVAVFRFVEG